DALDGLSAEGKLQQQLWAQVGQDLESGLGDTINGLVTGTKSWKEAGLDLFRSLTKAASDYIAKLLMMKLLSSAGSAAGFLGFANGGAFNGSIKVKPFANGGVIG